MSELADLFKSGDPGVSLRRARVISVSGRNLTVDLGGEVVIPATADCYPLPDQSVLIAVEGSSMTAIAAIGGVNRQPTLITVSSTATTVTGLVNGVSRAIPKAGAFTVVAGDELPLFWAADASDVWVLGKAGVPYVPPPPASGGGGSGGGGGGTRITTGTATYAAKSNATFYSWGWGQGGHVSVLESNPGAFFYGYGRFRELQGRTITGFRANLIRQSGTGSFSVYGHPHASTPGGTPSRGYSAGSASGGGWTRLPIGLANYLIAGSGTGGLTFGGGSGSIRGIPYGALQFDWRK